MTRKELIKRYEKALEGYGWSKKQIAPQLKAAGTMKSLRLLETFVETAEQRVALKKARGKTP